MGHLLEKVTELGETVYLLEDQLNIKGYIQLRNNKKEEKNRARWEGVHGASTLSLASPHSQHLNVFTN